MDFWATALCYLPDHCLSVCLSVLSVCPVCLWRWCIAAKRLGGSRWNLAWPGHIVLDGDPI